MTHHIDVIQFISLQPDRAIKVGNQSCGIAGLVPLECIRYLGHCCYNKNSTKELYQGFSCDHADSAYKWY